MIRVDEEGAWVVLRETIALHHDEVFAALTTEGGLVQWFPLNAKVDLRQGGEIVFGWDRNFEKRTTIAILDYDPGGRIVWDWYARASDTHAPVYWFVEPKVEKGSRVVMEQGPFKAEPDSLIAMAEEAESWRWYLCNMRSVLEAKFDMRPVRPL